MLLTCSMYGTSISHIIYSYSRASATPNILWVLCTLPYLQYIGINIVQMLSYIYINYPNFAYIGVNFTSIWLGEMGHKSPLSFVKSQCKIFVLTIHWSPFHFGQYYSSPAQLEGLLVLMIATQLENIVLVKFMTKYQIYRICWVFKVLRKFA